jgi:hypothetical protein
VNADDAKDKDSKDADEDEDMESTAKPEVDPVRNESLNIMNDLISLSHSPKTASASPKIGSRN